MSEMYAVVEGKGEKLFGEQMLAVHLGAQGIFFRATQAGKPGHKSAVAPWGHIRRDVLNFLRKNKPDRPVHVTTMFDYFRMPLNWPGRRAAADMPWQEKARTIEIAIAADVEAEMGSDYMKDRFIPYVQVHEFEALIFAAPQALGARFPDRATEVAQLVESIGDAEPESVNDGPTTAPSRRIVALIPEYEGSKASAASDILQLIGLDTLRDRCGHFAEWLARLEALALGNSPGVVAEGENTESRGDR